MTVQIALVGGAHIHTPGFINRLKARSDVSVCWVWDRDPALAQRRAEELGTKVADTVEQIWQDGSVEGAVICSETDQHEALVQAGAAAGKHLFVEKPLGMAAEDAARMAAAIESAGVLFQTGYFMRGSPIFRFLKEQLVAGAFGMVTRVRMINCHAGSLKGWFDTEWRWMTDPAQAGVGGFGDLGTHALDILLWLFGPVSRVTADIDVATGRYGDCDEFGEGLLKFENGTIGSLAAGWVDVAQPVTLTISGTEGHAHVADGQLYYLSQHVPGADGKTPWTDLPEPWPHAFDLFLDAVTGKEGVPLVSASEAAYRSAVMGAMYAAARQQTWLAPARL
jgi:predicted dehydrogenase